MAGGVVTGARDPGSMRRQTTALATLARNQHGVFSTSQAHHLGFTRHHISTRCRRGDWIPVQRSIFRLAGSTFGLEARLAATCLCIPGAVASHESAAWLHGFPYLSGRVPSVVCVKSEGASTAEHARVHRYDGLEHHDLSVVAGLPVTNQALTIFHLSAVLPAGLIARIVDDRLSARAVTVEDLLALADYWTRRGRPRRDVMRRLLRRRATGYVPPASALEYEFLAVVRHAGLPEPVKQSPLPWDGQRPGRVDFFFPDQGVVVEVDGRRWHAREGDFENDRQRDRLAQLRGLMALRYTWYEVTRTPRAVVAELTHALDRSQAA